MAGTVPCSRVLLVEGQDDEHVVRHIVSRLRSDRTFAIEQKDGFPNLAKSISLEVKVSGRIAVGIIADANDNPQGRWQTITDHLKRADIEVVATHRSGGVVIPNNPVSQTPKIGIWLMPDNSSQGELEDFVAKLVPPGDPVWPLAEKYIESIPPAERRFSAQKKTRALLHAWLAVREEPRRMGMAIGAGDLDVSAPEASGFADWLRRLFE